MPTGYFWRHSDERGFAKAFPEALARAYAGNWKPTADTSAAVIVADYRSLILSTLWALAALSSKGIPQPDSAGVVRIPDVGIDDFPAERKPFAEALTATLRNLYVPLAKTTNPPNTKGGPQMLYTQIETRNGDKWSTLMSDAGWAAALAEFGALVVKAAVVVYLVEKGLDALDNELERREESKRMVSYHATLTSLLAAHAQREVEVFGKENAGKPGYQLPLTDVERATLAALQKAQLAQINAVKKESPSIFPDLKGQGGEVVKTVKQFGTVAIVVAGVVAYVILKKGGS